MQHFCKILETKESQVLVLRKYNSERDYFEISVMFEIEDDNMEIISKIKNKKECDRIFESME